MTIKRLTAMKNQNTIARINTKSNYRNLNGQWLRVVSMNGTFITCEFVDQTDELLVHADFRLSEIAAIKETAKFEDNSTIY